MKVVVLLPCQTRKFEQAEFELDLSGPADQEAIIFAGSGGRR